MALLHAPSLLDAAYHSGIYKACSDDTNLVSVIVCTENLLMTLACFFATCHEGDLNHTFGLAQFDFLRRGCIVPLAAGISAALDSVGQYDALWKAGFDPVLNTFTLHRRSEVDRASYVYVQCPFLGYKFANYDVSSLPPSLVGKRYRSK